MQGTYFNLIPSELITDVIIEYLSLEDLYNFVELFDENINQKILLFLLRSYHNKDLYNIFIHYKDNIPSIRIIKMLLLTVGVDKELTPINRNFFQKAKDFFNYVISGSNYEISVDRVRNNFHKDEVKLFFKSLLIHYYPKMYDKIGIIKKIIKHDQEYYLWRALLIYDEYIDEYGYEDDGINMYIGTGVNYSTILNTFTDKIPILLYYLYFYDIKPHSKISYSIVNVIINKMIKELPLKFKDEAEVRKFLNYVLYASKL